LSSHYLPEFVDPGGIPVYTLYARELIILNRLPAKLNRACVIDRSLRPPDNVSSVIDSSRTVAEFLPARIGVKEWSRHQVKASWAEFRPDVEATIRGRNLMPVAKVERGRPGSREGKILPALEKENA